MSKFDLSTVGRSRTEVIILEIGSDDLCHAVVKLEIMGSKIESLVQVFHRPS